jgi:hypothetical protein
MSRSKRTDPTPCACGCGKIPARDGSEYCAGHNPHHKGGDNPNWKGGKDLYCKRAYAKVKADPEKFALRREQRKEWTKTKRENEPEWWEVQKAKKRSEAMRYRERVLNHYGHKCACCGEDRYEFLSVDHMNGDGAAHRRVIGGGKAIYRWLVKHNFPDGFQILCHNCNFAMGAYGYCPHHTKKEKKI